MSLRIEVDGSEVRIEGSVVSRHAAEYLARQADRELAFTRAIEIGAFCLERMSTSGEMDFVKREVDGLLAKVSEAIGRIPESVEQELMDKVGTDKGQVLEPLAKGPSPRDSEPRCFLGSCTERPLVSREGVTFLCMEPLMNTDGNISITLVTEPERFLAKIRDYQHEPEVFIDIETAEWWTPTPRVALLQVLAGREVAVFDVLAPGMKEVLVDSFIPHVMANERIRKWAHNASYERRFLGGDRVQNLECTLRLARGIAFHRLPTETLSLAALAGALLGVTPDKTLQKADWAIRPLSQEHITYAAEDTVYCSRVRTALEAIDKPPRPEEDDPESIDNAFSDAKLRELNANAELRSPPRICPQPDDAREHASLLPVCHLELRAPRGPPSALCSGAGPCRSSPDA